MAAMVLTFTTEPAAISSSRTVPPSGDSHSATALSVWISATTWPGLMTSPALTRQATRVPSDMVGDKAGNVSSVIIVAYR